MSGINFNYRSSHPEMFYKKGVLKNFTNFNCARVSGFRCATLLTLSQVFSCEFCEIFKNTFFYRTSLVTASEINNVLFKVLIKTNNISCQTFTICPQPSTKFILKTKK